MQRRQLLLRAGGLWTASSLGSFAERAAADDEGGAPQAHAAFAAPPPLAPIAARPDRIIAINVCTRPFRAEGPRIEAEAIGRQTVVHNYGHGGSGWSLSWGSAALAVRLAATTREKRIAVIGCGAIGLTSALVAQRAGLRVRIYARERPPDVRSSNASGVWSPDSRICAAEHATPAFQRRWETMARASFRMFQTMLGLAGDPVEWRDFYSLQDAPHDAVAAAPSSEPDAEPDYPDLESSLLADLHPRSRALAPADHPFPVARARLGSELTFNIGAYSRLLMQDFLLQGGEIETRDFENPRQFAGLPERTVVNATGYGARSLFRDESVVPVRGQTVRLVPQPEVRYGLRWGGHNLFVVPRRDGLLVQAQAPGDFGNADTVPDRAAADAVVLRLAALFDPAAGRR